MDIETEFYYLQTRYYDPAARRFISPDNYELLSTLAEAGDLNLYTYCGNNPVMGYDPTGEFVLSSFLIGMAISAAIGAAVGAVAYTASEVRSYAITGNWSWSWAQFTGSVLGGAIGGAVSMIPGVGLPISSFITGFASSAIGMGLQNAWEGTNYSLSRIIGTSLLIGGIAAATAIAMNCIRIQGLNAGRGSYLQVSNQIKTKFWNGTIKRITYKTATKIAALSLYYTSLGVVFNAVNDAFA